MTVLVRGKPGSGKSALAEDLAIRIGDRYRYYLATMKICDEEGIRRVEKHRKQREGKGFITIERLYGIREVIDELEKPGESTLLLECAANLVGNEMHDDPERRIDTGTGEFSPEEFADAVFSDIRYLSFHVHDLIVVTDDYERNDEGYDDETRLYVELLNLVNERLAAFSDKVFDTDRRSQIEDI